MIISHVVSGSGGFGFEGSRVRWLECESVRRWRAGVRASTFQTYWSWMRRFLSHVRKDPDEFLQWCRGQPEKWMILEVLQQFIRKFESKRYGTCESGYSSLKSFLLHNRIDLPRDLSFQIHAETPPVERQITLENLRELIMLAPQPWRSMLLVKWQGIMDTEALIYTSNHYSELLVDAIKKGHELIKLTIPGRKKRED